MKALAAKAQPSTAASAVPALSLELLTLTKKTVFALW